MNGNWKSKESGKVSTEATKKSKRSAIEVVRGFNKRLRDGDLVKEIEEKIVSLNKQLKKLGEGRHNIRPRRILIQKINDLKEKKHEYLQYDRSKL